MKTVLRRTIVSFVLLVMILSVYAWLHHSPPGELFDSILLTDIELPLRLRNGQEHDAARSRNGGNPYIFEVDSDERGALFYYGASHTTEPNDPQIEDITDRWNAFEPTVALYESRNGFFYGSLIESFAGLPEPALVHKLARTDNVPLYSLEPSNENEIGLLLDEFSKQQVALYYVLRVYASESGGEPDESLALHLLSKRTDGTVLQGSLTSIDDLDTVWQRDFPNETDWRTLNQEPQFGYLRDISFASRRIRGEHMTRILIHLVRQGERVFAVAGSGHIIRQEWNLRDAFGLPPSWDQPLIGDEVRPLKSNALWSTFTEANGLPSNEIRSIMQDQQGRMWFGTRGSGIAEYDGDIWTMHVTDESLILDGVSDIIQADNGDIIATGAGGFGIFRDNQWTSSTSIGDIQPRVVFSVNEDDASGLWFGADGGCGHVDNRITNTYTTDDGLPHSVVHACLKDSEDNIWFATRQGLGQLSNSTLSNGTRPNETPSIHFEDDNFGSIVEDPDGNVWFGTRSSGVRQFSNGTWTQYLGGKDVRPTAIDASGRVWAVSDSDGAYVFTNGSWVNIGTKDGLPSTVVFDVMQSHDGAIWFATDAGVTRFMAN